MKQLIALEPEVFASLKKKHQPAEKTMLEGLDAEMSSILHSDKPESVKIELYNQALLKANSIRSKKKLAESQPPLSDANVLKPFKQKTKAKKVLEKVKQEKNISWDSGGVMKLDGRDVPNSHIHSLVQRSLKKPKSDLIPLIWESY